jgi:hypothetical protein
MKKMLSLFLASALLASMATAVISVSAASTDVTNGERVVTIWDGSNIPDGSIIEKTTDLGPDGTTPWFSIDANKRAGSYVLSLDKATKTVKATVHKYTSAVASTAVYYQDSSSNWISSPVDSSTSLNLILS